MPSWLWSELDLSARVRHVLGINGRNLNLIFPHNLRRYYPLADDKLRTKEVLERAGIPVPETLRVFESFRDVGKTAELLSELTEFVIKPSKGRAGSGIVVVAGRTGGGWLDTEGKFWPLDAIRQQIANIVFGVYGYGLSDRALVERRLAQARIMGSDLFPGLPDIRVITLEGRPVMSMLRLPTWRSHGKANLHQGAVGVGVDLETGRTVHASFRRVPVLCHPDTGTPLVDLEVAGWREILKIARRTAAAFPLGYLGVDIAVDVERGPVVLEINVRPGLEIQNANQRGLREVLRRCAEEARA